MTSFVTATASRSATLAPETRPALSQPTTSRSATLAPETWPALSHHSIKVSYSCSRNMTSIVTPQHQGQLLLLQKHDQHCHSHNIKVSYSCSRNMTSIVTATATRSATLAPETWPPLSQPQHQGQLLQLQKRDKHCHSHSIKVSYSCSRNMASIVTATASRSATLAPETWPALSQPTTSSQPLLLPKHDQHCYNLQHQGQLLLLQKHDQHCHSHNIKVSYSCSRNMNSIATVSTSRSATLAPETWPALSQPQHQGQLLLLQKHDQHCHNSQK